MSTLLTDRERWWCVIGYEASMLRALASTMINISSDGPLRWLLTNSITEGKVLHTRNLCDFCTSKRKNDIKPSDLFDNYHTDGKYDRIRELIDLLEQSYGRTEEEDSARWVCNKMLAHPTKDRGKGFEYGPYLERVWPVLQNIIYELERLRGQPFP